MTKTTNHTTKRLDEVRFVLRQLLAKIEVAEAEASDTKWEEEQDGIIGGVLSEVSARCSNLSYAIMYADSVLTARERGE